MKMKIEYSFYHDMRFLVNIKQRATYYAISDMEYGVVYEWEYDEVIAKGNLNQEGKHNTVIVGNNIT